MKQIKLSEVFEPDAYLEAVLKVQKALLVAAERSNDLRQYAISSLMVKQLSQAKDMLLRSRGDKRNYCYRCEPFVYYVEDSDTVSDIMNFRDNYSYNPAMG